MHHPGESDFMMADAFRAAGFKTGAIVTPISYLKFSAAWNSTWHWDETLGHLEIAFNAAPPPGLRVQIPKPLQGPRARQLQRMRRVQRMRTPCTR